MPKFKKLEYPFLLIVSALLAIGLIMIFSASPVIGLKKCGDAFYFIKRHLFYLVLGLLAMFYGFYLDLENLKKKAFPILAVSIVLLIFVFLPGVGRNVLGASRWIDLGFISFQPSELIKLSLLLFLAKWLSDKKTPIKDFWQGVLPALLLFGFISIFIIKQPDMGTTIVLGGAMFCLLFIAGSEIKPLAIIGGIGALGVLVLSIFSPYRLRRLTTYLDPWKDRQGAGFQVVQSLLAIGSGGLFGVGLGASRQKYFYLPQQYTDFIFAILCEELGLLGGAAVVILFALFAGYGFKIARLNTDPFKRLLAAGIVSWLTVQATINIMVVVGLIPTTGIPLPFISYGGTATIINLFSVGIVLNVSRKP